MVSMTGRRSGSLTGIWCFCKRRVEASSATPRTNRAFSWLCSDSYDVSFWPLSISHSKTGKDFAAFSFTLFVSTSWRRWYRLSRNSRYSSTFCCSLSSPTGEMTGSSTVDHHPDNRDRTPLIATRCSFLRFSSPSLSECAYKSFVDMLEGRWMIPMEFRTLELVSSLTKTPGNLVGSLCVVRADVDVVIITSAIKLNGDIAAFRIVRRSVFPSWREFLFSSCFCIDNDVMLIDLISLWLFVIVWVLLVQFTRFILETWIPTGIAIQLRNSTSYNHSMYDQGLWNFLF